MIISCGKKQANSIVLPGGLASGAEAAVIDKVLEKIGNDFADLNIHVPLHSIPYHVAKLEPGVAGLCVFDENKKGKGIAIDESVFIQWGTESEDYYGFIYKILLHEIGHCFFERDHDNTVLNIPGKKMLIEYYSGKSAVEVENFEVSVMIERSRSGVIPKSLWTYYLKEVAGLDRISSVEDLESYVNVEVID